MKKVKNRHVLKKIILIRLFNLCVAIAGGIAITYMINYINAIHYKHPVNFYFQTYLFAILAFYVYLEGAGFILGKINKRLSLFDSLKKRYRIQLLIIVPYTFSYWIITSLLITFFVAGDAFIDDFGLLLYFVIGLILSLVYCIVQLIYYYSGKKEILLKKLEYEKENVQKKYQSLKDHLSPHFLFNNLHTLYGLIDENQKLAADFVLKLSDIYRYVLEVKEQEVVALKVEVEFIDKYLELMRIRYGSNLKTNIKIDIDPKKYYLPPLTLQTLIENVQKHNYVDEENSIGIEIYNENTDYIVVKNNINKILEQEKVLETGLLNLKSRFGYLSNKEIEIIQTDSVFIVKVPLIQIV